MRRFEWLKGVFSFSRSETRGIIVLLLILTVLLVVKSVLYRKLDRYDLQYYYSADTTLTSGSEPYSHNSQDSNNNSKLQEVIFHAVDPNKATYKELIAIGLPTGVARNLIKFREKGAIYYTPDDLLKVYGFDSLMYRSVKDFLYFSPRMNKTDNNSRIPDQTFRVELNRSDSMTLKKLPGIGPVLAARIIKYRNLLGGFYSPKQLTEVYGINDSLFVTLSKHIEIDTFLVNKMNINSLTLEELERHPYLNKFQAKAIVSYRRLIGQFTSVSQLVTNYLVPEETYYRLFPYMTIN